MEICKEQRQLFISKVREGVKELIHMNKIEELDEFDAGLYITNVFSRTFKDMFDENKENQAEKKPLKTLLWSSVYSNLEVEKYEKYILEEILRK